MLLWYLLLRVVFLLFSFFFSCQVLYVTFLAISHLLQWQSLSAGLSCNSIKFISSFLNALTVMRLQSNHFCWYTMNVDGFLPACIMLFQHQFSSTDLGNIKDVCQSKHDKTKGSLKIMADRDKGKKTKLPSISSHWFLILESLRTIFWVVISDYCLVNDRQIPQFNGCMHRYLPWWLLLSDFTGALCMRCFLPWRNSATFIHACTLCIVNSCCC